MMRALGFGKDHVIVFVVLQAVTFAIPGVILGLIFSVILTHGLQEALFIIVQNYGDNDCHQ